MVKTNLENKIFKITLNRPEVKNAFHPQMIADLTVAFQSVPEAAVAVVFSGEGTVFCAGADLNWMKSMVSFSMAENLADSEKMYEMFLAIRNCPKPVICRVQGAAFGGALGFMAASDVVIVDQDAKFCFSEVKLGIAPAVISSFVLEKCPRGQVMPFLISGKVFTASDAAVMGLAHCIGAVGKLDELVNDWISAFAEAGPQAVTATKQMLHSLSDLDVAGGFTAAKEITTKVISERRMSPEGQEGLKSFLEKRTPSWRG